MLMTDSVKQEVVLDLGPGVVEEPALHGTVGWEAQKLEI